MVEPTNSLINQRINFEKVCDFKIQNGLILCPREDTTTGNLYVISTTGELITFNEGAHETIFTLNGEPHAMCIDSTGALYIADMATNYIFYKQCK